MLWKKDQYQSNIGVGSMTMNVIGICNDSSIDMKMKTHTVNNDAVHLIRSIYWSKISSL